MTFKLSTETRTMALSPDNLLTEPNLPRCLLCVSCSVMSNSFQPRGPQPARLLCPWDSPGKNTGVGCHFFLHGIFPTQVSNLGLLHCRQILYHLNHKGGKMLTHLLYGDPCKDIKLPWMRSSQTRRWSYIISLKQYLSWSLKYIALLYLTGLCLGYCLNHCV